MEAELAVPPGAALEMAAALALPYTELATPRALAVLWAGQGRASQVCGSEAGVGERAGPRQAHTRLTTARCTAKLGMH